MALQPKLRRIAFGDRYFYHQFNCPGCGIEHAVKLEGANIWAWNGDLIEPTLNPSILVQGVLGAYSTPPDPTPYLCHSFIENGRINFLNDCTHALRGWHDLPRYVKLMD